jgi:hypothetical protein
MSRSTRSTREKPAKEVNWLLFDTTVNPISQVHFMSFPGYSLEGKLDHLDWAAEIKKRFRFPAGIIEFWRVCYPLTSLLYLAFDPFLSRIPLYRQTMFQETGSLLLVGSKILLSGSSLPIVFKGPSQNPGIPTKSTSSSRPPGYRKMRI